MQAPEANLQGTGNLAGVLLIAKSLLLLFNLQHQHSSFSEPPDSRTYVHADSHVGAPMTYLRVSSRWNANHVKQQLVHLTVKLPDIHVKLLDILSQIAVKLFDVIPHVAAFVLDKSCFRT